ncbi:MAG: hypothetical protein HKP61_12575 [Dactylosporangium sp.]|nr:alpha/beta hydrolase family protein [Dactylosporangium sp.]NNJ61754.1 hypothetical protein [Dactylosporangium sp.]
MTLTISQVLGCDVSTPDLAGVAFDDLATVVDDRADEFTVMLRDVEDAWEAGQAREAALRRGSDLRGELAAAQPLLTGVAQALRGFAADSRAIVNHLRELVNEAEGAGYTVTDGGSVSVGAPRSTAASAYDLQRDAARHGDQIRQLLERADALDESTIRKLTANRAPNSASGPGSGAVARESVPRAGTDPAKVHQWWDSLTDDERRYLIATYPDLVGALDGVPVTARDQANRIVLDSERDRLAAESREMDAYLADLRRRVAAGEEVSSEDLSRHGLVEHRREEIAGKLRGIDQILNRLESTDPGRPRAYLVGFSTADDGRAIVAIGNPDTADNVLTYVPGTGADLSHPAGDIRRADYMAEDANRMEPTAQTATIMWLGYDAPDTLPAAADHRYADGAVADLNRFQNGLRATHEGTTASHNVVLGHSYGTTVIGHTATQTGITADELVLVASPGVGTNDASDLRGVSPEHVWATRADGDPIHWAPDLDIAHGNDPTRKDFGGQTFTSDPGDHSSYWKENNPARANIARIVTGQDGEVR